MSTTTWADAYGVWHARVPLNGREAETARDAIADEIISRDAHADDCVIGVELIAVTEANATYRETVIASHHHYFREDIADIWCDECDTVTDYCQQLNPF